MKGLIFILGESFRMGGQGTRIRGIPEAYDEQINACNSHIRFLNHIKMKYNVDIDVHISTYTTQYNHNLLDIYKDYMINYSIYDDVEGLTTLFQNAIKKNSSNIDNYDFIFFFRIDLFLKDSFFEIFNPNWTTIRFPTNTWTITVHHNGKPRPNDVMIFIPKRLFYLNDKIAVSHEIWYDLSLINVSDDDLDVMINTFHDSDSQKDWNPLYYMVNREQTQNWHDKDSRLFNKKNIFLKSFNSLKYTDNSLKKNLLDNVLNNDLYIFIIFSFLILILIILISDLK